MGRKELIGALIFLQIETTLALACIIATIWNTAHVIGATVMTILSVLGYRELLKELLNKKNNKSNGI